MLVGAHVSISGGFSKCLERAREIGANCLQTFASSPRSLSQAEISESEIEKYLLDPKMPHFFHGVYLVNLASDKPDYIDASIKSLVSYQKLAAKIGAIGTIFHIGSGPTDPTDAIKKVLDQTPDNVKLILENSARDNIDRLTKIQDPRLGICIDTQHAWAAGHQFEELLSLPNICAVHLNDSKSDFGSKVDRHENLGQGKIGEQKLKEFIKKIKDYSLILEVPGEGNGPRKQDIDMVKNMLI